jgi:hypothetical protein
LLDLSSLILPHLPFLLLRTISSDFILLFSYTDTKYNHHIYWDSPFPYAHPPHTGTHPWKKIYLSLLTFIKKIFKCILIVQKGFALWVQVSYLAPTASRLFPCLPWLFLLNNEMLPTWRGREVMFSKVGGVPTRLQLPEIVMHTVVAQLMIVAGFEL